MTYCITKQKLFNIKVLTIEIVVFALWLILLIRTLTMKSVHAGGTELGLLVVSIILGILVIRGVVHETKQRNQIEQLSAELEHACAQLKKLGVHLDKAHPDKDIPNAEEVVSERRDRIY